MRRCVVEFDLTAFNEIVKGHYLIKSGIDVTHVCGIGNFSPLMRLSLSGEGLPEKYNWEVNQEILHADLSDIFQ